ncbi:cytochrome P450 [Streptomyces sp. NPDC047002]|uniref:cytochrome P450 n=1 Tax=Streptomyces sp. NPDC047002 TaxID=3155475 RepID=UPI003453C2FF
MRRNTDGIVEAPGRLPLLGHAVPLARRPVDFLVSLAGIDRIVRVRLGSVPVSYVADPGLVHELLTVHAASLEKGRFFDKARPLLGDGLVTSSGALHRRQRRLCQRAFTATALNGYLPVMEGNARRLVGTWRAGRPLTMSEVLDEFTLRTVVDTMFSADLPSATLDAVRRLLPTVLKGTIRATLAPGFWSRLPTPGNRRFRSASAGLRAVFERAVREQSPAGGAQAGGLLPLVLADGGHGGEEAMDPAQACDELITFLAAGYETTSSALGALFYELNRHPAVEERVHEELDRVLSDGPVTESALAQLHYTRQVVTETLRLHAPPWILMRRNVTALRFGGHHFPVGTEFLFSPQALHRDPRSYADPLSFDPDRWRTAGPRDMPPGAWLPFGAGRRSCIGAAFAQAEMMVFVATACRRWRLVERPPTVHAPLYRAVARFPRLRLTPEPRA